MQRRPCVTQRVMCARKGSTARTRSATTNASARRLRKRNSAPVGEHRGRLAYTFCAPLGWNGSLPRARVTTLGQELLLDRLAGEAPQQFAAGLVIRSTSRERLASRKLTLRQKERIRAAQARATAAVPSPAAG